MQQPTRVERIDWVKSRLERRSVLLKAPKPQKQPAGRKSSIELCSNCLGHRSIFCFPTRNVFGFAYAAAAQESLACVTTAAPTMPGSQEFSETHLRCHKGTGDEAWVLQNVIYKALSCLNEAQAPLWK